MFTNPDEKRKQSNRIVDLENCDSAFKYFDTFIWRISKQIVEKASQLKNDEFQNMRHGQQQEQQHSYPMRLDLVNINSDNAKNCSWMREHIQISCSVYMTITSFLPLASRIIRSFDRR